jgi:hypothetical protein
MELDLDAIETDLADVEIALARLESGEYWTCEITGEPIPDEWLAAHPTARRRPPAETPPAAGAVAVLEVAVLEVAPPADTFPNADQ